MDNPIKKAESYRQEAVELAQKMSDIEKEIQILYRKKQEVLKEVTKTYQHNGNEIEFKILDNHIALDEYPKYTGIRRGIHRPHKFPLEFAEPLRDYLNFYLEVKKDD